MQMRVLNMARRLRPTSFNEMKGQDFSLSMLKNSLYSNTFFPTYLFTGQRGCGKTTTGRIFAAALNCEALEQFQKTPSTLLPCQVCSSCLMMKAQTHPDFVEIDAASHTGVDDVRAMLEASCYVPLQGRKKIYLIDEAHMLSKAAFNALLKMLEEPPKTALFMLATTEYNKIPATVRSRCFQVHFNALEYGTLATFLTEIAVKEEIVITHEAVNMIITLAEGCVRDALNILEQISFATKNITEEVVLKVMGMLPKEYFFSVIEHALAQNPEAVLDFFEKKPLTLASAPHFLYHAVHFFRAMIRVHYKIPLVSNIFTVNLDRLQKVSSLITIQEINLILRCLWIVEGMMSSAHQKEVLVEHLMLLIATRDFSSLLDQKQSKEQHVVEEPKPVVQKSVSQHVKDSVQKMPVSVETVSMQVTASIQKDQRWQHFIDDLLQKNRMLASIFQQAEPDLKSAVPYFNIVFSVKSGFFQEKIAECKNQWHSIFLHYFPDYIDLAIEEKIGEKVGGVTKSSVSDDQISKRQSVEAPRVESKKMLFNPEEWPQTAEILKEFPGTVEIIQNDKK
jgi:DNA polymerase III subunit gamma/tau